MPVSRTTLAMRGEEGDPFWGFLAKVGIGLGKKLLSRGKRRIQAILPEDDFEDEEEEDAEDEF